MSKLLVNTLSLGTIGGTALYFWGKSSIPTTPVQLSLLVAMIDLQETLIGSLNI